MLVVLFSRFEFSCRIMYSSSVVCFPVFGVFARLVGFCMLVSVHIVLEALFW